MLLSVRATLELGGIAIVASDVLAARRTIKNVTDPDWLAQDDPGKIPNLLAHVAGAGTLWHRVIGVGLFAIGLIVQTFANFAAL